MSRRIYVGSLTTPLYYFEDEDILAMHGEVSVSLVGEELAADTCEPEVVFEVREPEAFIPTDYADGLITADSGNLVLSGHYTEDIRLLPYGTKLWYYDGDNLVGQFYVKNVERIGRDSYRLNATSFVGILDKEQFYGKLESSRAFNDTVKDILLYDGIRNQIECSSISLGGYVYSSMSAFFTGRTTSTSYEFKLRYDGVSDQLNASTQTAHTSFLFGHRVTYAQTVAASGPWGIYAYFTRSSSSVNFDNSLTLQYIGYDGTNEVDTALGTYTPGTTLTIIVNDNSGTVTVNGIDYSVTRTAVTGDLTYLFRGSTVYQTESGGTWSYVSTTGLKWTFYYAKRYESNSLTAHLAPTASLLENNSPRIQDIKIGETDYQIVDESTTKTGFASCGTYIYDDDHPFYIDATSDWYAERSALIDSFQYDDGLAETTVTGWVPQGTRRNALYQLLFAVGAVLTKTTDGGIIFQWLKSGDATTIADDRIYNTGDVDYNESVSAIEVAEHTYALSSSQTEYETMYETTTAVENLVVPFGSPHSTGTSYFGGLIVNAWTEAGAIVSGTGTLTARPYVDSQAILSRKISDSVLGSTITVTDATLVSQLNSETVADRLEEYYTNAKIISNDIVHSGERCSGYYSFTNPFEESATGFLRSMSLTASKVLKASCEFVTNFIPTHGNNYSKSVMLTGSGTWTVPAEVFAKSVPRIKVTLIGGGNGGNSGMAGENGEQGSGWASADGGDGGAGGTAGTGGNIYTVTLTNPSATYSYACGSGGAGGAASASTSVSNLGSAGSASTFGSYTSASGSASSTGFINFFTGKTYASPGTGGLQGADGSYITVEGDTCYYNGLYFGNHTIYYGSYLGASGGGGGGGYNVTGYSGGSAGGDSYKKGGTYYAGTGGNGASANAASAASTYGAGGAGGTGGGGGGCSGIWNYAVTGAMALAGTGGSGGAGGAGGAGCIIIYY